MAHDLNTSPADLAALAPKKRASKPKKAAAPKVSPDVEALMALVRDQSALINKLTAQLDAMGPVPTGREGPMIEDRLASSPVLKLPKEYKGFTLSSDLDDYTRDLYDVPTFGYYKGENGEFCQYRDREAEEILQVFFNDGETIEEARANLPLRLEALDWSFPAPWTVRCTPNSGINRIDYRSRYDQWEILDANGEPVIDHIDDETYANMIARMMNRAFKAKGKPGRGSRLRMAEAFNFGPLNNPRRTFVGLWCGDGQYAGEPYNDDVAQAVVDVSRVF